jgi:hypothetical protein
LNEIAVGTGVGLRFDFTFFVLRLDVATPLRDPANLPGDVVGDQGFFFKRYWVERQPALQPGYWVSVLIESKRVKLPSLLLCTLKLIL